MASDLAHRLHNAFVLYGYKWKIDGVLRYPTETDLDMAIDKAKSDLYAEPIPSQMEMGHLIIRHYTRDKFDIYLHIGDANNTTQGE